MMQGKLSQGQLLSKIIEELNSAKDKLEHIYTGKDGNSQRISDISQERGPEGGLTTQEVKQTLRKLPRRACRMNANKVWVRGVHDISNEKMMEAIDIVLDEGCFPGKLHVNESEIMDMSQFMSRKVNMRTERNPTVRKAMASSGHEGWKQAMVDEWNMLTGVKRVESDR